MNRIASWTFAGLATVAAGAHAATAPVAVYTFQNSLASSVAGAPALVAVDPLGQSGFVTDTVDGTPTTVYSFSGLRSPTSSQAGFTLDVSGILAGQYTQYSVELVFKFTERENAWRRIIDVSNRSSDSGFYVDPSNRLNIFPVASGNPFANDAYQNVFLVNDQGTATFYLDGASKTSVNTTVMNVGSHGLMHFFLDDNAVPGEYSSGSIALIRIWDTALDAPPPPIPEPGTWALMAAGMALVAGAARRRA